MRVLEDGEVSPIAENVIILRIDGKLKQSNSDRYPAVAVLPSLTTTHSQRNDEPEEIRDEPP